MGERLAAPYTVDLECASTLRGLVQGSKLPADAAYVALAESLDADLVTIDGKLTRTPGLSCTVRNLRA